MPKQALGRPRIPEEEKRTVMFRPSFTTSEAEQIERLAAEQDATPAQVIRDAILKEAGQ